MSDSVIPALVAAACDAGMNALGVLSGDFEVDTKDDNSPVTRADFEADRIIRSRLRAVSELPIVSEEHPLPSPEDRSSWSSYFLVDPLDGTRGFIERGDEFGVSIALMDREVPTLGVIALPIQEAVYIGGPEIASVRLSGTMTEIARAPESALGAGERLPRPTDRMPPAAPRRSSIGDGPDSSRDSSSDLTLRVVASRHNLNAETRAWIEALRRHSVTVELVQAGSAAKFAMIAEGAADVYPRMAPCMEWDTAAGVAIVHGAGGRVIYAGGPGAGETGSNGDTAFAASGGAGRAETIRFGDRRWRSSYFIAWSAHALSRGWGD